MSSKYIFTMLFVLTLVFGVLPFVVYNYEISNGILTNANEWYQTNNHGPWRYSNESFLIFTPQLILMALIILTTFLKSTEKGRVGKSARNIVILGVLLILMQFVVYGLHFYFLGWTFD